MIERIEPSKPSRMAWLAETYTLVLPRWVLAAGAVAGVALLLLALD
jgi:hypothetical protein